METNTSEVMSPAHENLLFLLEVPQKLTRVPASAQEEGDGEGPRANLQELNSGHGESSCGLQQTQTRAGTNGTSICPIGAGFFYLPMCSSAFLTPPRKHPAVTRTHSLHFTCQGVGI